MLFLNFKIETNKPKELGVLISIPSNACPLNSTIPKVLLLSCVDFLIFLHYYCFQCFGKVLESAFILKTYKQFLAQTNLF